MSYRKLFPKQTIFTLKADVSPVVIARRSCHLEDRLVSKNTRAFQMNST